MSMRVPDEVWELAAEILDTTSEVLDNSWSVDMGQSEKISRSDLLKVLELAIQLYLSGKYKKE